MLDIPGDTDGYTEMGAEASPRETQSDTVTEPPLVVVAHQSSGQHW